MTSWQVTAWAGWSGPERRHGERRSGLDRRVRSQRLPTGAEPPDDPGYYTDEWARARGAENFASWLDCCATAVPAGLSQRRVGCGTAA